MILQIFIIILSITVLILVLTCRHLHKENVRLSVHIHSKETDATPPVSHNEDDMETGSANRDAEESCRTTVLIANENDKVRTDLMQSLSDDFIFIEASDGAVAWELAQSQNPDIIISDMEMPKITGDELCRTLRNSINTSHIPFIIVSALCEREVIIYGLEAGADDYITIPFDSEMLKTRIKNILKRRQILREEIVTMDKDSKQIDYKSQLDKKFIDDAMRFIEQNLSDSSLAVNDLCLELAMSRSSLYNKMKMLTGNGPNDYIRLVRLNKAKELLTGKQYNITEVSVMVGFSDPKYFSTCFKKQFGISPSKI